MLLFFAIRIFFNCCSLIWMCSSKTATTTINKTHHRALKTVMIDFTASYEETLRKFKTVTIHEKILEF